MALSSVFKSVYRSSLRAGAKLDSEWKRGGEYLRSDIEKELIIRGADIEDQRKELPQVLDLNTFRKFYRIKLDPQDGLQKSLDLLKCLQRRAKVLQKLAYEPMSITKTRGIEVSITAVSQLHPYGQVNYVYDVTIKNMNVNTTVQLLTRRWEINDVAGKTMVVEGEGVIGEQPIIKPGASHTYKSYTQVATYIGSMGGHFTMQDIETKEKFNAKIDNFGLLPV
mmetsp:Transcript_30792/g.34348  ORF Transcript_30792/g.34348 Transcript_30792/m.34348 type:complete len:223 (+) Transcript_30792:21-689(+)